MPTSPAMQSVRGETRPDPDPTVRTIEQLMLAIANLKELMESQIAGIKNILETRLDGMEKAILLVHEENNKVPGKIVEKVQQLEGIQGEKFRSIGTQFAERDTRTEQTSRDSKVAVDAALQAAKEAVGEQNKSNALAIAKSEAAFTKQIDQIGILISTQQKGSDDKIDDLKARVQALESFKRGGNEVWFAVLGILGLLVAAAAMFIRIPH